MSSGMDKYTSSLCICHQFQSAQVRERSKENGRLDERRHQENCFSLAIITTTFNWNVPNS